tara:strand:- start:2846 stop:3994 length:1149 start_codon:yes stop_codon:yes gene_type:complete
MSEDVKNLDAEDIQEQASEEVLNDEEQVVEGTEEEVVEETQSEESVEDLEEAKVKKEMDHEEESVQPKAVEIPKTKAGVIQAAVDMLKSARKEDAQKLFAKMTKIDEVDEDNDAEVAEFDKAMKGSLPKKNELKAKAKVEAVDFDEDLDTIISEEATLSDGFRDKASTIFEAVLTSKLAEEVERLEAEYAQNLEEEVSDIDAQLVEKVDSYLNYVVENWMKENEVAVNQGLKTEIAEDFMTSLQAVFKEHYIEVPEGKEDLIDDLADQVAELEESLNKSTEENISLHGKVSSFEKDEVVRNASSGLAETEAEKLAKLCEDVEFDNKEAFEQKVETIKQSYFKGDVNESVDEVNSIAGEDEAPAEELNDVMSRYTQAITKFNK